MKVGWVMIGDRTTPSTRIMGIMVHEWLKVHGIDSVILRMPPQYDAGLDRIEEDEIVDLAVYRECTHVIIQKVSFGYAPMLPGHLREKKIKTIFILDDMIEEGLVMSAECDQTVAGSKYIRGYIGAFGAQHKWDSPIVVDAYETPRDMCKDDYNQVDSFKKLTCVWYGTMLHLPQAHELDSLMEDSGYTYTIISKGPQATVQWDLNTVWGNVLRADVVILPYLGPLPPYEQGKGNNRLTQAMVLGMPVVASPIPQYLGIIKQGKNGFIAYNNSLDDFKNYLKVLEDKDIREKIGKAARESVIDEYSIDKVGEQWKVILSQL